MEQAMYIWIVSRHSCGWANDHKHTSFSRLNVGAHLAPAVPFVLVGHNMLGQSYRRS